MIHRDLCDPVKTKYFSSLRMQFHFVLSRFACWDGLIPLTINEMASELKCDAQSVRKFIFKGLKEDILKQEGERLYLLKHVSNYNEGYIKHYPFLESAQFRSLNTHAQRFILYCLWTGVHTGRPLKRDITSLYHSKNEQNGVLNIYYREPVYMVLEEAKAFLKLEIIVEKNREMVRVSGLRDEYAQQSALSNQGEMKLLNDILWDNGVDELVSVTSKEDILKLKKHYVSAFQDVGVDLFNNALKKLIHVHKLWELNINGEVGQYLRSVLLDLEKKVLVTLQKQLTYISNAIETTKDFLIDGASKWLLRFEDKKQMISDIICKIKSKINPPFKGELPEPFPFYNWLESN